MRVERNKLNPSLVKPQMDLAKLKMDLGRERQKEDNMSLHIFLQE